MNVYCGNDECQYNDIRLCRHPNSITLLKVTSGGVALLCEHYGKMDNKEEKSKLLRELGYKLPAGFYIPDRS